MSTHLIVCIKSVVKSAPKGVARRTPDNCELNPFDRPALEAAIQIKENQGGQVTALSMGPFVSLEALAEARAMGVDRAVLISDRALAESDTLVTARVLAKAVQKIGPFDLLLFGTRTADSDTGQVGPQTAAVLNLPFVSRVKTFIVQPFGWTVKRTMDMWEETWDLTTPAAATIDARGYTPRPVSLNTISEVYDQPGIEQWDLNNLDIPTDAVGLAGSPTRVASLEKVNQGRNGLMLEGEPQEQANALMERLVHAGLIG
jgi:electron transfer flavoprotein beta subunit